MIKNKLISLLYFVLFVILGLLISNLMLIAMIYSKGIGLEQIVSDSKSLLNTLTSQELLITQLCSQVFTLIIPAWVYSRVNPDSSTSLNTSSFALNIFFISLLFFLSCIPLVAFSSYLNQLIPLTDWMNDTELQMAEMIQKMLNFQSLSDLIIALVVIAAIPAIAEEWVFRGIVQNQFISWTKNKWIGLLLASIFFSAIHMQFQGFLPRCVLGLILGFVYMNTGNLWHSILLHFFNNGFQVIGAYVYREEILKQLHEETKMPNPAALAFSVMATVFMAYYLIQKTKRTSHV
jgi:membrane protease YdiL (CAAX protease family)